MFMCRWWGNPGNPYPHYISTVKNYTDDLDPWIKEGEWNAWRINPYLDLMSKNYDTDGQVSALVTCPNNSGDFMQEWIYYVNWPNHDMFEFAYSYWVIGGLKPPLNASDLGTENGQVSANVYRDLTVDMLSPKRLLMSEILNLDYSDECYRYNHGRSGWSWNEDVFITGFSPPVGHRNYEYDDPIATGRSQLFGDGHVQWRAISSKPEDNLPSQNYDGRLKNDWNDRGSGWVADNDTDYY
jgi:hypothetical protein